MDNIEAQEEYMYFEAEMEDAQTQGKVTLVLQQIP